MLYLHQTYVFYKHWISFIIIYRIFLQTIIAGLIDLLIYLMAKFRMFVHAL